MADKLRVVFAGTPDFAIPALDMLLENHQLLWVFTQPDAKVGRGQKVKPSAVKSWCLDHHIPFLQPEKLGVAEATMLMEQSVDVMVVAAYGQLVPSKVLSAPRWGCLNIHASLLPRWRGASPIQYALLHGDDKTGVSIMQMERGLDTGPVFLQKSMGLTEDHNAQRVTQQLAHDGADALQAVLSRLPECFQDKFIQDDSLATHAPKIEKSQALINWSSSQSSILQHIRAFYPWPTAFTFSQSVRIKVIRAVSEPFQESKVAPGVVISCALGGVVVRCSDGAVKITALQFPGKNPVDLTQTLPSYVLDLADGPGFTS